MRGDWLRGGVALALLWAALGCASAPAADSGSRFDYDWSADMLGGGEVELAALRGRVLVVNVWATWCPPCVEELASFQALRHRLEGADPEVTFLFVSPEDPETVRRFVDRQGYDLPFATEARWIPPSLGPLVLPTTFIVAADGVIALRHRGASDWSRDAVVRLLGALAAEGAP